MEKGNHQPSIRVKGGKNCSSCQRGGGGLLDRENQKKKKKRKKRRQRLVMLPGGRNPGGLRSLNSPLGGSQSKKELPPCWGRKEKEWTGYAA